MTSQKTPLSILNEKVLIVCGSGGVGKTTVSASIALEAARQGKKAIVITIDPAKRLSTSLGISGIHDEPKDITALLKKQLGEESIRGSLHALMLDAKGLFDRTILKNSPSQEFAQKILNNHLYQILSSQYGGSQEYMAVQQLMETYQHQDFDLIVLDTPPTRNALDFLDAPSRLTNFLDEKVIDWFAKPIESLRGNSQKTGLAARILSKGSEIAFRVFEKLVSTQFLQDFSVFIHSFYNLRATFFKTAQSINDLLSNHHVGFLLVCSPEKASLEEGTFFKTLLKKKALPFLGTLINRVTPEFGKLKNPPSVYPKKVGPLISIHEAFSKKRREQLDRISAFNREEASSLFIQIPDHSLEVNDLEALFWVAGQIFSDTTSATNGEHL